MLERAFYSQLRPPTRPEVVWGLLVTATCFNTAPAHDSHREAGGGSRMEMNWHNSCGVAESSRLTIRLLAALVGLAKPRPTHPTGTALRHEAGCIRQSPGEPGASATGVLAPGGGRLPTPGTPVAHAPGSPGPVTSPRPTSITSDTFARSRCCANAAPPSFSLNSISAAVSGTAA